MNETVTDAKGRKIEVKEVVGSALARMTRIAGASWGENAWTTGTLSRATVQAVDGVPAPPAPQNIGQMDALWDSVDADAASAALEWLINKQKALVDEAKNSSAPQASSNAAGS